MSRISLLLHKTKGKAQGWGLITIISYECLWYNWLISYSLWLQTVGKETSNIDDVLDGIDIKISLIEKNFFELITIKYACEGLKSTFNVSQGNNCTLNKCFLG